MRQYLRFKAKYKDAILFFRMGDFYEMFYDDAKIASQVLGIALTSRAHGKAANVPLAGFPHHALDAYLTKMVKAGYKVAICEQVEDPKKAKVVVKRDVLEVVTPGTVLSDSLLDTKRNNFLVALYLKGEKCGLAAADVSTGDFVAGEFPLAQLKEQVVRAEPAELLVSEEQLPYVMEQLGPARPAMVSKCEEWVFHRDYAYELLTQHFGTTSLRGFGCEDLDVGVSAAGAVVHYLKENQKSELRHLNRLSRLNEAEYLGLDASTRRNLELVTPLNPGATRATLLSVIDRTLTPMGGRMLVQWLLRPLTSKQAIDRRLDAVEELVAHGDLRQKIRDQLRRVGDLERLMAKVNTGRANARDLQALMRTLALIPQVRASCGSLESALLREIHEQLEELGPLVDELRRALVDDPPLLVTEGGIIRSGYNAELDELRAIAFSGKDWIAKLQTRERERTGIPSLKVSYNKVFGYYIEVTKPHLSKVPADYVRKQTTVGAERFITPELKEYEEKILGAEEKMAVLEYELFDQLRKRVALETEAVQKNARLLAQLDCLASLADVAVSNRYVRPQINESTAIVLKESRHPVIECLLPAGQAFVPNDLFIDSTSDQILIITGPNMAGKSTYLRQVGLIVIMAQMGSFVPAKEARIGLVDKIFTRVGASDNLAGGESTFLTEMNETANILNNATPRSLILLDEIGRGTSTFDGLSIAWAVAEFLHNTPRLAAKTMFATHYHELTELALILPRVKNYNVAVKEWGDRVVFLRKIVEGGCDHSYGIHVAQLAGLPREVIERAKEILANLEAEALTPSEQPKLAVRRSASGEEAARQLQLDIFAAQERYLADELRRIDLDNLTPLQALNKLSELKKKLDGENS
ncbi:MAG: DNA mismatch repair protein MutS [Calditrichaeota bacterium]|nr:DNA mismatch repair protein MutS [Calditrichota bacterium]